MKQHWQLSNLMKGGRRGTASVIDNVSDGGFFPYKLRVFFPHLDHLSHREIN